MGLVAFWVLWLVVGLVPIATSAAKAQSEASALMFDESRESDELLDANIERMVQSMGDLRRATDSPQWRLLAVLPGIGKIQTETTGVIVGLSEGLGYLTPHLETSSLEETLELEDSRRICTELSMASSMFKQASGSAMRLASRPPLRPVAGSLRALSKGASSLGSEIDKLLTAESNCDELT